MTEGTERATVHDLLPAEEVGADEHSCANCCHATASKERDINLVWCKRHKLSADRHGLCLDHVPLPHGETVQQVTV